MRLLLISTNSVEYELTLCTQEPSSLHNILSNYLPAFPLNPFPITPFLDHPKFKEAAFDN